jgi:hypothetical protein
MDAMQTIEPPSGVRHRRDDGLGHLQGPAQIDVQHGLEVLGRNLEEAPRLHDPGAVHEHVEPAEPLDSGPNRGPAG